MEDVDKLDNIQDGFIHTRNAYKSFNQQDRAWLDMRLHESHEVGGFGVTHKTVSRHAASYTNFLLGTIAHPAQQVWLRGNDLQHLSTWGAPPLHSKAPARGPPSEVRLLRSAGSSTAPAAVRAGGGTVAKAGANPQPQHVGSQDNSNGKNSLPQLNRLYEAFKRSQVLPPVSSST